MNKLMNKFFFSLAQQRKVERDENKQNETKQNTTQSATATNKLALQRRGHG